MDLIAQQRLTRPAWDREVAKMVGWGAMVDPSQANDLAGYLAARFGPYRVTAAAPLSDDADAHALLEARCTICHATDLIDAQRLDAEGWRRELTKMMGWGAVLSPAERDLLVAHLGRR